MKKIVYVCISTVLLFLLVSCSQDKPQNNAIPKMLDVNLNINPEKGNINQPITFNAKVTQGSDNVNDADEVIFEIWRSKDPIHEKITIKNPHNGVYSLKKSFQVEGTYYIISHVTARGLHTMPKKEFIIGSPSDKEDSNSGSMEDGMKMK